MMLDELMDRLRSVEAGYLLPNEDLAGEAADAIELLLVKIASIEEKLAYYKQLEKEGRLVITVQQVREQRTNLR